MAQRVLNVENGPGSNGLRGGIKKYTPRTQTGPWMDEYGGTAGYRRGFTTEDFETEAQHAQYGAVPKPLGYFGSEIADPAAIAVRNSSIMGDAKDVKWESVSQDTFQFRGDSKAEKFVPLEPTLPRDKLEDYRKQWTTDSDVQKKMRFRTESRLSSNQAAAKKFRVFTLRMLPGTPRAMEDYRKRLVERYGVFCVGKFKLQVGKDPISSDALWQLLKGLGVPIKPYEYSQMLAYLTPSTQVSAAELEKLKLLMRGHMDGFDSAAVRLIFKRISPDGAATAAVIHDAVRGDDENLEILDGMLEVFPAYSSNKMTLSEEEFINMHCDMFFSVPNAFEELLKSVWGYK